MSSFGSIKRIVAAWACALAVCSLAASAVWAAPSEAFASAVPAAGVLAPADIAGVVRDVQPSVVGVVGKLGKLSRYYSESSANISQGSGIVYKSNGYVITNNHVIEGCDEVYAVLSNKRVYKARIVGTDMASDLALLKVDKGMLKPVWFEDGAFAETGAPVFSMGTPITFDLQNSVGYGVISGVERANTEITDYYCLQTDAAANEGNSGGPVFSARGGVLGILVSKIEDTSGIAFCVTSNTIEYVAPQLLKYGRVRRPYAGARLEQSLSADYGLPGDQGLYITDIDADGPLAAAGATEEDYLLALNGAYVNTYPEYAEQLKKYAPGDAVELTLRRGRNTRVVRITFTEKAN